jgi:hypothetical protein
MFSLSRLHMERHWRDKFLLIGPGEAVPAWLRIGLVVFSLVLSAQAIWILLAELQHPRRIRFPVDQSSSVEAVLERAGARRAAKLAVVRGDLWAESAFTHSDLLWTEPAAASSGAVDEARIQLERTLRYSPHRGDVWLLLAAMADRYDWKDYKPSSLLKMSYYTRPKEQALILLRIKVSLQTGGTQDPELLDMIGRDIRLLITRAPAEKPALVAIYKAVPSPSKQFIERVVSEIDPAYLADMRAGSQ